MTLTHRPLIVFTSIVALLTCGCSSSESIGGSPPPVTPAADDLVVTGVTVRGRLPQNASVTVRAVPDQDATVDRDFRVAFRLDGAATVTSLPRDPGLISGQTWNAALPILSTTPGGVTSLDLIISLAP